MYCTNCGAKNDNDAKFCIYCGTRLEIPSSTSNYNFDNTQVAPKQEPNYSQYDQYENPRSSNYTTIKKGFLISIMILVGILLVFLAIGTMTNFIAFYDAFIYYSYYAYETYMYLAIVHFLLSFVCMTSVGLLVPTLILSIVSIAKKSDKFSKALRGLTSALVGVVIIHFILEIATLEIAGYDFYSLNGLIIWSLSVDLLFVIIAILCNVFSKKYKAF